MLYPDKYLLVVITDNQNPNEPPKEIVKVYGTWYGGYGASEEWRINSGIVKVEKEDDHMYKVYGHSGTVYGVGRNIGATPYTWGNLEGLLRGVPAHITVEIVHDPDKSIKILESFIEY